jgi:hypothetical protein
MRRLFQPLNDEVPVRQKNGFAVAPHFAWRDRTGPALPLRPLHHRRHRNAKPRRYRPAALADHDRSNHSLTKIIGERSAHQMLAPSSSQHLESQTNP